VRFCGSVDAIRALNEGRCLIAGFHAPLHPPSDSLSALTFRPLLQPGRHKLIGFADRSQGLMVPRGNPLALDSLVAVARHRARLALRDKGSGTRLLFDAMSQQAGLSGAEFVLTPQEEPSHLACAAAVAGGFADVALGIASAAASQGLDFVPLQDERYYLVCLKSAVESPAVLALRQLLQTSAWRQSLERATRPDKPDRCNPCGPNCPGGVCAPRRGMPIGGLRQLGISPRHAARTPQEKSPKLGLQ
jgi:molybdate-binding protein